MFDAVYYINLDNAVERRKKLESQLHECGLENIAIRVDAVRGAALSEEEIKSNATKACAKFCSRRLIGCAMSHLKTWSLFLQNSSLQSILVLEDDAMFTRNDIMSYLESINHNIPSDWDVLYLGCFTGCDVSSNKNIVSSALTFANSGSVKTTKVMNEHIVKPALPLGTHAYIINRPAAERLLEQMKNEKIFNHVDFQMNTVFDKLKMNVYALRTPLVVQQTNLSVSNIAQFQFPVLLNKVFDTIEDHSGQSLAYKLSVSLYESCPTSPDVSIAVNAWMLIFVAISLILWKLKVSIPNFTAVFFLIFILDFMATNGDLKVLIYAVTYYLILLLPHVSSLTGSLSSSTAASG